jgi:hypothetical protein
MRDWKSILKADPTDWLLEYDNPSVRYLTLTDILDKPQNDAEVIKAKNNIMLDGVVSKILSKQQPEGYWGEPDRMYVAKYKGTVWQVIILAELLADEKDKRIKNACEFLLENSQDHESGGFSMHRSAKKGGGRHSEVIPCLTGNLVYSLIRLGYLDDPRVQRAIDWITTFQRFDDGVSETPKGWPYIKAEPCWGKHTCHMGVVKALKALSEVPVKLRNQDVQRTIADGADYLLKHHIFKKSHDLSKISKPGWKRFGFPLMYQTDILEVLLILTKLDYKDERMQDAIDIVVSKQDEFGKWRLDSTFNGRFQVNIEKKENPSKWITLNAIMTLKRYYG